MDLVADFAILKNDGKANFTVGADLPFSGSTTIGDVNRDGRNDLLISTQDGPGCCTPFHAHVLLNQGNGNFKESAALSGVVAGGFLADVNHDGNKDYLAYGRDGLIVFPGNGDGTFDFPANYATGGTIVVADFNGDGHLDALSSGGNSNPFLLALGNTNGDFAAPRVTLTTNDPALTASIATGDFNGDKKPDIAVLSQGQCHDLPGGGPRPVVCPPGRVAVAAGTGLGYLQPPRFFSVGVPTGVMAVGDVNGDGKMDIVVTRAANLPSNQTSSVPYDTSVLLGRGDGTFAPAMNYHLLGYPAPLTEEDAAIYLLDVNGDGKLDLVGDWGVALGNGNGTFKAPIPLPSGLHVITGVTPGDFNRDGKVDLEIASFDQQTATQSLVTLLGDGKGAFTIAHTVPFTAPGFPQGEIDGLLAADVNGDGIPDLLYTGINFNRQSNVNNGSGLYVQLGRGDGTFAAAVKYPAAMGFFIFTGDFNRDGLTDVLVSTLGGQGDLVLFKGVGKGLLSTTPQHFFTGTASNTGAPLVVVNLNGDTAPDVAGLLINGFARILNTAVH